MRAWMTLVVFYLSVTFAIAQNTELESSSVPKKVTESFTKEQPGITPAWRLDGKNYKAIYTDPKSKLGRLVVFDKEGNVLRREDEMDKLRSPPTGTTAPQKKK